MFNVFKCFALFLWCDSFVLIVLSDEPRQNQGRGLVDRKLVEAPSNFIAGHPKAALLFWFSGGFRCGVLFFSLFLLYINTKIGKNICSMLD